MKSNLLKSLLTGLVAAGLGMTAQALPSINGAISFTGGSTTDTGNLGTATALTGYSSLSVLAGAETGNYLPLSPAGNGGGTLSFTPFSFAGSVLTPSPLVPLWTITYLVVTYSFDATSVLIATQTSTFLNLTGSGIAHETGYADSPGTWSITDTTQGASLVFTFGASTTVPDGGTTVLLLGAALSGLALIRRKLA